MQFVTIGDMSEVRVEIALTQEMLPNVSVGQTARITIPSRGDTVLTGQLVRISPFPVEGTYSAEAEIDVPNPEGLLRPGMFVTAEILYGESEQATLVPNSALYENPTTGQQGIYMAPSLGLFPLALGLGAGAALQASLARVVIGGLLTSTLITLILIPVVYVSAYAVMDRPTTQSKIRNRKSEIGVTLRFR